VEGQGDSDEIAYDFAPGDTRDFVAALERCMGVNEGEAVLHNLKTLGVNHV
jgi:hypothetical protein